MGCDIHCYAEKKMGSKWVKVGNVFPNPYYSEKEKIDKYNKPKTDQPYKQRNYDLFGMLANVRNGSGFAGCDTGDGFIPIAMPKGLPEDVSDAVKAISERWNGDGHSHSWFTVAELKAYNWDKKTKKRGWVNSSGFLEWKKNGSPNSWCGSVGGGDVKHLTVEQMQDYIDKNSTNYPLTDSCYCQVEWEIIYRDYAGVFLDETIPALEKLGKPENVRIVFFFDN